MLKEIKIIDKSENEILPDKENLIALPKNDGGYEFITKDNAENMLKNLDTVLTDDVKRIIKGQLLLLEAEKVVSKTSSRKRKTDINRKTGGDVGSTE